MEQKTRFRATSIAVALVLVVAVAVGAYLWRENAELKKRLDASNAARLDKAPDEVRRVREGDELPEFTARDTEGQDVKVAARGAGNTLLFIYSPTCDRCEAGFSSWVKVSQKLEQLRSGVKVLALSIEDSYTTVEHARRVRPPFPAIPFPNIDLQKKYGATEVPLTVVLDSRGIVQAVWDKPLDEGEVGDVIETVCPECPDRVDGVRASK
jgi:peroxiredoxin